jgi:putative endonuclease
MYYAYVLQSVAEGELYKGSTESYLKRLEEHNRGECQFTKDKLPWKLIFVQEFNNKQEALARKKELQKCNKEYLQWLVKQPQNVLNNLDR